MHTSAPFRRTARLPGLGQLVASTLLAVIATAAGCGPGGKGGPKTIQNKGSDTMVEAAVAWASAYRKATVEVAGGGSGVGITGLKDGTVDIANSSRKITPEEAAAIRERNKAEPTEFLVGFDALAVCVNKSNPLEEISVDQLKEVFIDSGKITKWSDLGVKVPGCDRDEIVCLSRANNSGTYMYFKEAILGKKGEYRLNCISATGSRDLVLRAGNTPCAIGYSGMGYTDPNIKFLRVKGKDGPGVLPSVDSVHAKTYPIARPLLMYTIGEPTGATKEYLEWIRGADAQKILGDIGYVPLTPDQIAQGH